MTHSDLRSSPAPNTRPVAPSLYKSTARIFVIITAAACFSCLPSPRVSEVSDKGNILILASVPLKESKHLDLRFDRLIRWYSITPWFQGAGGQPTVYINHYYFIVDGAVRISSGRTRTFKWIGPYRKGSPYFIRPDKLVIAGRDAFIRYSVVKNTSPSECTELVKYGKYKGTRWRLWGSDMQFFNYPGTYKWSSEYVWTDVTREAFERAAGTGDEISLQAPSLGSAEGICAETYKDKGCTRSCEEANFPWRREENFRGDVMSFNFEKVEQTLNEHPEFARPGRHRDALHIVIDHLRPGLRKRDGDKARRMLALLFRHNYDVNALDYDASTPLQRALKVGVERDIVNELVRRGGRVLYPVCEFRKAVAGRYPALARGDVIREIGEQEGWISDDVYQIWLKETGDRHIDGPGAKKEFLYNFDLEKMESDAVPCGTLISLIAYQLGPPEDACHRSDPKTGTKQWLARLAYPGLRDIVRDCRMISATPFPNRYPVDTVLTLE